MSETRSPEALFWQPASEGRVRCLLCPRGCLLAEGQTGVCRARGVRDGKLYPLTYAAASSIAEDPIEKKPLYHFYPGRTIFSLGSVGCNLTCSFCQNHAISQAHPATEMLPPEEAVRLAAKNSIGIAFTYNEPTIGIEYVLETARLARRAGLKTVLVTNGFIEPAPAAALAEVIDAANVDIKSFREEFYQRLCTGSLAPVLKTSELWQKAGMHLEITNLLIPGENDTDQEIAELSSWIRDHLDPKTPLHFSAYFPRHKMTRPATEVKTLERAYEIAVEALEFVYLGNVRTHQENQTICPRCGEVVIDRQGYKITLEALEKGRCARCGEKMNIQNE